MPTNGQPQPPVPRPPQPVKPQQPPRAQYPLHPEAESLAFGYSDLLMELDTARGEIARLRRQLDAEQRERIYWKNFVRQVRERAAAMLDGEDV